MIKVKKLNEAFVRVEAEEGILSEISEYFTFEAPNAKFDPRVKKGYWDGQLRLFNKKHNTLPQGLVRYLQEFAKDTYPIEVPNILADVWSIEETKELCLKYKLPFEPHDHQYVGIAKALRYRKLLLESSTSSGKSLIAYVVSRHLVDCGLKGLIIVPTVNLVQQMYGDFKEYGGDVDNLVHRIYAKQSKNTKLSVTCSTWQSIFEQPEEYFEQFDFVICDEVHLATAKSIQTIMSLCVNAQYRIGMTGTIQDAKVHRLALEGHFGPVCKIAKNKEMQDKGISAQSPIKAIVLKHTNPRVFADYKEEMDYICELVARNNFIKNLALSLKQNTVILHQYKKQGNLLLDMIKKEAPDSRRVMLFNGDNDVEEREELRKILKDYFRERL